MPVRHSVSLFALAATGAALLGACGVTPDANPIYQQSTSYKVSNPNQAVQYADPNVQQANYYADAPTTAHSADLGPQQAPARVYYAQPGANNTYTQPAGYVQTASPQQAGYTRVNQECLSAESNRKIIGTVAGGAVGALAGRKIAGDNKTLGTAAGAVIGGAAGYGIADKTINCDPVSVPAPQAAVIAPAYQQPQTHSAGYQTAGQPNVQPASITENTESLGELGTPGYYAIHGQTAPETPSQAIPVQPAPTQPAAPQSAQSYSYSQSAAPAPATTPAATPASTPVIDGTVRHTLQPGDTVYSLARKSCSSVAAFKSLNGIDDNYYIRAGDPILLPAGKCAE